jgi:hypothetical protein
VGTWYDVQGQGGAESAAVCMPTARTLLEAKDLSTASNCVRARVLAGVRELTVAGVTTCRVLGVEQAGSGIGQGLPCLLRWIWSFATKKRYLSADTLSASQLRTRQSLDHIARGAPAVCTRRL